MAERDSEPLERSGFSILRGARTRVPMRDAVPGPRTGDPSATHSALRPHPIRPPVRCPPRSPAAPRVHPAVVRAAGSGSGARVLALLPERPAEPRLVFSRPAAMSAAGLVSATPPAPAPPGAPAPAMPPGPEYYEEEELESAEEEDGERSARARDSDEGG